MATRLVAAKPPSLIVGGIAGLQEIGLDGKVIRTMTATPARYPRYLSPDHREMLFLVPSKSAPSAGYREIRRISVNGQRETGVPPPPATS
jgi:hypothetical protein